MRPWVVAPSQIIDEPFLTEFQESLALYPRELVEPDELIVPLLSLHDASSAKDCARHVANYFLVVG
jgi:hypothetical protein